MLACIYDSHPKLLDIFRHYCALNIEGGKTNAAVEGAVEVGGDDDDEDCQMTAKDWCTLIEATGMLGSSSSEIDDELTLKEVRQAFSAAQAEMAIGDAKEKASTPEPATDGDAEGVSHLQLMSYPEVPRLLPSIYDL